jgi:hypothetical protein
MRQGKNRRNSGVSDVNAYIEPISNAVLLSAVVILRFHIVIRAYLLMLL